MGKSRNFYTEIVNKLKLEDLTRKKEFEALLLFISKSNSKAEDNFFTSDTASFLNKFIIYHSAKGRSLDTTNNSRKEAITATTAANLMRTQLYRTGLPVVAFAGECAEELHYMPHEQNSRHFWCLILYRQDGELKLASKDTNQLNGKVPYKATKIAEVLKIRQVQFFGPTTYENNGNIDSSFKATFLNIALVIDHGLDFLNKWPLLGHKDVVSKKYVIY